LPSSPQSPVKGTQRMLGKLRASNRSQYTSMEEGTHGKGRKKKATRSRRSES
jgi:hypothetical protein